MVKVGFERIYCRCFESPTKAAAFYFFCFASLTGGVELLFILFFWGDLTIRHGFPETSIEETESASSNPEDKFVFKCQ